MNSVRGFESKCTVVGCAVDGAYTVEQAYTRKLCTYAAKG